MTTIDLAPGAECTIRMPFTTAFHVRVDRRARDARDLCAAESRLVRRIEQPGAPGDLCTRTTDYEPEIDVPIDPVALTFDPPRER